jgi:hypothetical protein
MHYKKYHLRSPLFSLRDPRLSALRDPQLREQVLAAFSGARKPLAPPPPPREPREAGR